MAEGELEVQKTKLKTAGVVLKFAKLEVDKRAVRVIACTEKVQNSHDDAHCAAVIFPSQKESFCFLINRTFMSFNINYISSVLGCLILHLFSEYCS